jgi:branched-chain amino acid transport system substrate-binding protein
MPADQRPKTLALIQLDDPNTTQAAKLFGERLGKLGVKTVYNKTYAPDTSNFDTIANAIKQAKPDLVINGSIAGDGISLIRSFQKVSFSPEQFYQLNTPTDPSFAKAIGAGNTEGIFTYLAWSPEAKYPTNTGFVAGYTKQFKAAPGEDAANSYTAGQVLAGAVKAVGKLDQTAIADWLHKNTVDTIVGPLKWDGTGKPQGDMLLAQFQGGKIKIIKPDSAATSTDILFSKPGWSGS